MVDHESSNGSFSQPAIPKFNGNYEFWSMLMENLLHSKEYWEVVENGIPPLAANATPEQRKIVNEAKLKDRKARNYLFQAIDQSILETITKIDSSKGIWDCMKEKYQGSAKVKRAQLQALKREFEVLNMKEGEGVNEYFSRTLVISNKMRNLGSKITDTDIVDKILNTMTPEYNYVTCSIEQAHDIDTLSIDALQSNIIVQEYKMKSQKKEEEQALKVTGPSGRSSNTRGRGRGNGRGRGKQLSKDHIECYKCHKMGHYQSECPNLEEKQANIAEYEEDEDEEILLMACTENIAEYEEDEDEENLLMACTEERIKKKSDRWFLDSGCSNHMSGVKSWFFNLDENFREFVKIGNGMKLQVMGKGNIRIKIDGRIQVITDVYFILELKNNLISIGQLQHKGLKVVFEDDYCTIHHKEKGLLITSKMANNKVFTVIGTPMISE